MMRGPSKIFSVGTRLMRNQIPHPMSSPDQNLSKETRRYDENTNTKSSFFLSPSKINKYYFIISLRRPILDLKIPLMSGILTIYHYWMLILYKQVFQCMFHPNDLSAT